MQADLTGFHVTPGARVFPAGLESTLCFIGLFKPAKICRAGAKKPKQNKQTKKTPTSWYLYMFICYFLVLRGKNISKLYFLLINFSTATFCQGSPVTEPFSREL